jgi:6-phosphogluconolactonase (cycloisomerase 2 family)
MDVIIPLAFVANPKGETMMRTCLVFRAVRPAVTLALGIILALVGLVPAPASAAATTGAVYVLTNQKLNAVLIYARAADGTLQISSSVPTGGAGMGTGADPLGSQGSLVLGRWGRLLFAANAGSNDVSVFAVKGSALELDLLDRASSGGTMPVSIAVHGSLVYVLNAAGTTPNIQGFSVDASTGHLNHLAGSERPLPGGKASSAAEVAFTPDGDTLVVTEKGTNRIDTWHVNDEGFAEDGQVTDSSGATPFGFDFARGDVLVVSEAGSGTMSSYEVEEDEPLEPLTRSLSDTQKADCWVVVTRSGKFAFTTNTGSGSISSYQIVRGGYLALLNPVAANTGAGTSPVDMALSGGGRFLYVREATKGVVDGFQVESDGSLTPVTSAKGVPAGAQGVAAR